MDMIKVVITAVLISFGISAVACPVLIPFLKKIKFGQQVTRGWTAGTSERSRERRRWAVSHFSSV